MAVAFALQGEMWKVLALRLGTYLVLMIWYLGSIDLIGMVP